MLLENRKTREEARAGLQPGARPGELARCVPGAVQAPIWDHGFKAGIYSTLSRPVKGAAASDKLWKSVDRNWNAHVIAYSVKCAGIPSLGPWHLVPRAWRMGE